MIGINIDENDDNSGRLLTEKGSLCHEREFLTTFLFQYKGIVVSHGAHQSTCPSVLVMCVFQG